MTLQSWSARSAADIQFGAGVVDRVGEFVSAKRVLLVTSAGFVRRGVANRVKRALGERLVGVFDQVEPNPDVDALDVASRKLHEFAPDILLALGGGSAIDTAKALAVQLAGGEEWSVAKYFRGGAAGSLPTPVPVVAVPTTAGTGSEVTPFATVWDYALGRKYSLNGPDLRPVLAILDPELTLDLPADATIASGLDAVSQALESIWNRASNPVSMAWALQSLRLSLPTLAPLTHDLHDLSLRARMLEASLLAGLAIAVTRTSIAHSMSYPLTARFGIPHGLACSFTLPSVLAFNLEHDDGRLDQTAQVLGLGDARALGNSLRELLQQVGAADMIAQYLPSPLDMLSVVGEMITPGRAENNMRPVASKAVEAILRDAIGQMWPTTI